MTPVQFMKMNPFRETTDQGRTKLRKTIIKQWLQIAAGLAVFAFGVHLTIEANIGLAPWDCLGMGISYHTSLNYGITMTIMAVLILLIDILLKEPIGIAMFIDAVTVGKAVDFFNCRTVHQEPASKHSVSFYVY